MDDRKNGLSRGNDRGNALSARTRLNILVVDDQPGKLLSYRAILGDLDENLLAASTAAEALNLLLNNEVAMILMDVSMPDLSGLELAEMVHKHPRFEKIPILFISAVHLSDVDRIRGYQRGAMDYISVPIVPEVLRAKVRLFADLYRKTRELENVNDLLEQRVIERTAELETRAREVRELNEQLEGRVLELRERAELLDLASEAVIVRDLGGEVRFWNPGATASYGWTAEEAIGRNLHAMLETKFPAPFEEIQALLAQGRRWEGKLVQKTKAGREIVVACRKSMLLHERIGGAVIEICRDITAELQAEEALRRSEKLAAMGKMAGIVAHEINNPLGALTNLFYLLEKHPSLDGEARKLAAMAAQEISRMAHITKQTLAFYRESSHVAEVSIPALLDGILALQAHEFAKRGITVARRYQADAVVEAIAGELNQVFLNLIGNAAEAMPEGGELRLHVHPCSLGFRAPIGGVCISILDTGAGISSEDAKHLFEPFFSTKVAKGTGLGLWISKGIVQKYDGRIVFRSVRLSGGNRTCFTVLLPGAATKRGDPARTAHQASIPLESESLANLHLNGA